MGSGIHVRSRRELLAGQLQLPERLAPGPYLWRTGGYLDPSGVRDPGLLVYHGTPLHRADVELLQAALTCRGERAEPDAKAPRHPLAAWREAHDREASSALRRMQRKPPVVSRIGSPVTLRTYQLP